MNGWPWKMESPRGSPFSSRLALDAVTAAARMLKRFSSSPSPLVDQMRRAEDRHPLDLAPVEQLAGDERRLDGLADADVVGDEQAHRVLLQRHHERHELVGARLDGYLPDAAERPGAAPEREQQRVPQEQRRVLAALLGRQWAAGRWRPRPARPRAPG